MKVLIDGDSLVYTIGFASQKNIWQVSDAEGIVHFENEGKPMCLGFIEDQAGALGELEITRRIEVSPVEHAFHSLKVIIQKIATRAKANSYKIYLTGDGNFREQVATIMGYKHNRKDAEKPVLYQQIRDYLVQYHKATIVTGMEADDALSIVYQRSVSGEPVNVSADPNHEVLRHPDECVIAAIDKDLRNIPGKHINFDKRVAENDEYKFIVIDEDEGRLTFWKQVLTGDSSDNILGIPGMGPKKADALLDPLKGKSEEDFFWAVYGAYKNHYGTEPFEYFRFDAYTDTTATFRKRELKPENEILPEQRLLGTALTMLLENARLLWMLRVAPNAEGTHWWMPPISFEDIELFDQNEQWLAKDAEAKENAAPEGTKPFEPWTEGRGKWFWADEDGVRHGKFGTKKKAKADIAAYQANGPNTSDGSEAEGFVAPAEPAAEQDTQNGAEDTQTGEPVNPVCQLWGFWDETWATWYGPYETEEQADAACNAYAISIDESTQNVGDTTQEVGSAEVAEADEPEPEADNNSPVLTNTETQTHIPEQEETGEAEAEEPEVLPSGNEIWDESF